MGLHLGIGVGIGFDDLTSGMPVPPTAGFLLFEDNTTEFELEDSSGEILLEG